METVILERYKYGLMSTLSKLYVNGVFICYALEDTVRGEGIKIDKFTAIPSGNGKLVKRYSPTFKRDLWCITNQDDNVTYIEKNISFKYVQFHGGNNHSNTEGCPLIAKFLIQEKVAKGYSDNNMAEFIIQGNAEDVLNEALKNNNEHLIIIKNI